MQPDVTVLGAGIVGICTALSLIERDITVRLVDRDEPGQATSFGNAGVISPWSIVPQSMPGVWKQIPGWVFDPDGPVSIKPSYAPRLASWALRFLAQGRKSRVVSTSAAMEFLNRDCVTLYRQHLQGTGHEHLVQDSFYVHAFRDGSAARVDNLDNTLRQEAGADVERIGPSELRVLEPHLSKDFQAAIVIKDQARALSPGKIGKVLCEKFLRQGGVFEQATVRAIKPVEDGAWEYSTNEGHFRTDKLVLAMGVWSAELLRPLGLKVPLQAERGYHVSFTSPGVSLNHSVMDVDKKFVASSMLEGLRIAGTAEFSGLDAPENKKRIKSLAKLASHLLPELNADTYTTWSGQRPSFPDSLPSIGEIKAFPNLITAFGHSHYGLMMAPKTGKVVADIVTGSKPNIDLSPYQIERF
ncbi:NAD(P)/FAD-dependent oxidoreductase [Roseovarius rhodophyticola]|uniref:FAD-dependent oxidoreductase n=1 Tax=Roseovarius rhodophyticola TaxID=3080827 RepID=A0ABZ2TJD1_9RHOB|nr:FAD-dependent oxidoreductase [Roseovarius sp. W115]MDV2928129.1 FAD-dependent oxidoreductase [Roseovarius sp. W115]